MSFGDRLGLAGLIVGLLAIAAFYLWPDKKWIGWLCLIAAVILSLAWVELEFQEQLARFYGGSPFGSTLIVSIAGGLFTGVLWWLLATTTLSPITWDFDHVLGIAGGGGQEAIISRFQVHGKNNQDRPIIHISGVWRSDLNGRTLPIEFAVDGQMVAPEETNGIPRKAEFNIYSAQLPSTDPPREGTVESKFFSVFGPFTLELTYDGRSLVRHFTSEHLLKELDDFRANLVNQSQPPSVGRRDPN